jgi:AcrR family transcriptional regulator
MRDPHRTAQQILEAAERVILRNGVAKATLDEIAREASISKGGVLHHFPSKEAVLVAVLQGLIARFEAGIDAKRKEDPAPKGAFTRAFLRSMLDPDTSCADVFLALNAAFSYTPPLLALHRETSSRWQRKWKRMASIRPTPRSSVSPLTDWAGRVFMGSCTLGRGPRICYTGSGCIYSITKMKLSLAILLLLSSFAAGCKEAQSQSAAPPPPPVEIIDVSATDVPIYSEFPAQTYARDRVEVRGRVAGYVEKWQFRPGDQVQAGQVLYVLDSGPIKRQFKKQLVTLRKHRPMCNTLDSRFRSCRRRPIWLLRRPTSSKQSRISNV